MVDDESMQASEAEERPWSLPWRTLQESSWCNRWSELASYEEAVEKVRRGLNKF